MQVVDSDLIEDVAAEDMGDLNGFVPGLVVSGDSPTQPRYQIRGIQTGDFGVGTDPAVGVYVDGIYAARSGASMLAFNDIERIEVLKGPQGTLFGRNSAAGAISIVTAPAFARVRLAAAGARRRVRQAVLRGHGQHADRRQRRAARQRRLQQERRLDAGRGHRPGPHARRELGRTRGAALGRSRTTTSATLSWDHDDLDQLARPAIGLVALRPVRRRSRTRPMPATYLDPRKAPIYNDVVGNEESRKLDQVNLFIDHSFGCGGLPLQHLLAPVRHREPRGRGRHEPDRLVLRHGEHRRQRELLPGVQVLRRNRRDRLGRRRELLQREGRPGQRHAHVHRQHRHAGHEPWHLRRAGHPVPAVRRHEQRHRAVFGVTHARPAVARSDVQPAATSRRTPRSAT